MAVLGDGRGFECGGPTGLETFNVVEKLHSSKWHPKNAASKPDEAVS